MNATQKEQNERHFSIFCEVMDMLEQGKTKRQVIKATGIKEIELEPQTITITYPTGETITDWR